MFKKAVITASAMCVLALCCSLALSKPQAELTVIKSNWSEAPISVSDAQATNSGLSVTVRNNATAPVEYFELRMEASRVFVGRCSLDLAHVNHPKFAEQEPLSLAPQESRTFHFPVKVAGSSLRIALVFLSDGRGYMDDVWLRKLDQPLPNGMLWKGDKPETEKHRVKQTAKREYPRNVGKSFNQGYCLQFTGNIISFDCLPPNGTCRIHYGEWTQNPFGGAIVTYLDDGCYYSFETTPCAYSPRPYIGVAC